VTPSQAGRALLAAAAAATWARPAAQGQDSACLGPRTRAGRHHVVLVRWPGTTTTLTTSSTVTESLRTHHWHDDLMIMIHGKTHCTSLSTQC
jgi:hypothetical protein